MPADRRLSPGVRPQGADLPQWKGGRSATAGTRYVSLLMPNHPRASSQGRVHEHVVVAERALGKPLPEGAQVHHVNENKLDNSRGNLVICQDHHYHAVLHMRARALAVTGNANSRKCNYCKEWDVAPAIRIPPRGTAYHLKCAAAYALARKKRVADDTISGKKWKAAAKQKAKAQSETSVPKGAV